MSSRSEVDSAAPPLLGKSSSRKTPWSRSQTHELLVVSAAIIAVTCVLWWRFLPLPHQDLNFYTEPAILLAHSGHLAGPGSQYVDLTYQKGLYNYPPGYSLFLAGWIRMFGFSPDSLLAYTHLQHAGMLILLWALLRFRYGCCRLISSLALLSIFPRMAHGRPDLTACFLSFASWIFLPENLVPWRVMVSGFLAGTALLVSPGYGLANLVTLTVLILLTPALAFRRRLNSLILWLGSAGIFFVAVTAAVLQEQHAWALAIFQFRANLAIRGSHLNVLPEMTTLFTFSFAVVPFLLLAVVPAAILLFASPRSSGRNLRDVTIAFLAAAFIWFATNKSQLLLEHHYLLPSKAVFLGLLLSRPRFPVYLRALPLLLLSLIGFYLYKSDFLYISTPLRDSWQDSSAHIPPTGEIAVDSFFLSRFYVPGRTLNLEDTSLDGGLWPLYLAAIPSGERGQFLEGISSEPARPSALFLSVFTSRSVGALLSAGFRCTLPPDASARLKTFGYTWHLPAAPYALISCRAVD